MVVLCSVPFTVSPCNHRCMSLKTGQTSKNPFRLTNVVFYLTSQCCCRIVTFSQCLCQSAPAVSTTGWPHGGSMCTCRRTIGSAWADESKMSSLFPWRSNINSPVSCNVVLVVGRVVILKSQTDHTKIFPQRIRTLDHPNVFSYLGNLIILLSDVFHRTQEKKKCVSANSHVKLIAELYVLF